MLDTKVCSPEKSKLLYVVSQEMCPVRFKNDRESVKQVRDSWCWEHFKKPYNELTNSEIDRLVALMKNEIYKIKQKENKEQRAKVVYPTDYQRKSLQRYMILTAIEYFDFSKYEFVNRDTGEMLTGEELRKHISTNFGTGRYVEQNILTLLYKEYINPHTNKYLIEGKFRTSVKNENVVYYDRLSQEETSYLIQKYSLIYKNKTMSFKNNVSLN